MAFQPSEEFTGSEILPGLIFLGDVYAAENKEGMQRLGIKLILNVADNIQNYHEDSFEYCNLNVRDHGLDEGISRVFHTAFAVLEECERERKPVLIHCMAGVNRSATITIVWLMHSRQMTLKDAWEFVSQRRPIVNPLRDNRLEMIAYEKRVYGDNTLTSIYEFNEYV
jgi:protein-tyrosine phosphatase